MENLEYHTSWKIIEEKYRKTILTEKLEIRIIELPKIRNLKNENDELLDWLFFLDNPNSERVIEKMKENAELKQANEKLDKISRDEHLRKIAEWREKAIIEENTALTASFDKGVQQGIQKGVEQGNKQSKLEIATELLKKGMSIEFVHEITHLSIAEIENIRKAFA